MTTYLPLDLANSANWKLRTSREETANIGMEGSNAIIEAVSLATSYHVLAIGCKSNMAKPNWWLGLKVSMRVFSSAVAANFNPLIEVQSTKCGLNQLTLIIIHPLVYPLPYWMYIQPPYWIKHIYFEVWEYQGETTSDNLELLIPSLQESLQRIESKIDNLDGPDTFNIDVQ